MSKSGFSTLNRWLGRKNKEKSVCNGKLSKSSTNLSISSTNINKASQLEYNRITPLPAATTNAPFEQTFRITVLLPKDQLYVTRLGARVPLSKLLELVCDNKLLDQDKYEFRNPVDPSQVYSCDLTIGAVGLSEIRLCHKSESYDNFNSDEIIKLHRTSLIRESLSSSEFSSRNSKHTTKTTSPYSSTNSLNSMDSSAVSWGGLTKPLTKVAPPRKKRAAPRPPSQTAIPEKYPLIIQNGNIEKEQEQIAALENSLTTKDFSVSTPNLASSTILQSDINGNVEDFNDVSSGNSSLNSHGYGEDTVLYAQVQKKNALNLNSQTKPHMLEQEQEEEEEEEETYSEIDQKLPEPSPRKRTVQFKKKTVAPPAPPPRNSLYLEDAVSIASTNVSCNSTPYTSIDPNKPTGENFEQSKENNKEIKNSSHSIPMPVPRITTTSTNFLNATIIEHDIKDTTNKNPEVESESKTKTNISKVLLNRTPTPEPRSLSSEPPEIENCYDTQLGQFKQQNTEEDCVSKQADSGIGEPIPSPLPDSLPSETSNLDVKSHFESSSDDDDMIKVYNFKLGKTLVKSISETKTLEELTILNNGQEETDSELNTPLVLTQVPTPNSFSETSSWNFAIPISPPPNFADNEFMDKIKAEPKPDAPITPKIMERPVLNFENLKQEPEEQQNNKKTVLETPLQTPTTPLDNIVQELCSIIQEKGVDSLMKKTEKPQEIEAATPNTLSNFSINVIAPSNNNKSKEVLNEVSPKDVLLAEVDFTKPSSTLISPTSMSTTTEEDKIYRKRSSISSLKQRKSITRSDSFHTTAAPNESINLTKRTSSQLSLDQVAGHLSYRRSSSELSIAESPSLHSLEIIKTILNSRKNSLANSSSEEDKEIEVSARRPSKELKFASLELRTTKSLVNDKETDLNNVQNKKEAKNIEPAEISKELPKMYRYAGPPSINFSTWSERPKSQVFIKNEGDYIFGGAKNKNDTVNNYCASMPVSNKETLNLSQKTAAKPTAIQRMGIPETNYNIPILVKPLQDVINNKALSNQMDESQSNSQIKEGTRPTVESVLRPQTQVIVNNSTNPTLTRNMQKVESVLRPQIQTIVNTSTLPRANKQRFSTPPVIAGPQLLRSASTKQQQESEKITIPGPQILRSSSINQQEQQKSSTTSSVTQAPFGQNTLRRTGFKEKILAQQDYEKSPNTPATTSTSPILNGGLKSIKQKLTNSTTSAKLHLNLKHTNETIPYQQNSNTANTCSPTFHSSSTAYINLETPVLKPKHTIPKTAPVLSIVNGIALAPTPPAPPMATGIQLKPITKIHSPTLAEDPRDDLLSAIRNFNKEGLKKA